MNNIWFFGDSFTYGEGCKPGFEYYDNYSYDNKRIWPKIITDVVGLNYNNLGERGSSTPIIINKLITNLHNISKNDIVVLSDSLPSRTIGANSKRKTIESVTSEIFETHYGLDNFFENVIEQHSFLNHITHNVIPNINTWKYYYEVQIKSLQKELLNRGVQFYFWSHTIWADKKDRFDRIVNDTDGEIQDTHFSWLGHKQMSELILDSMDKKKYIIKDNII